MHPAPSIIAFTTLSGLGFGLMAWLGIGAEPIGRAGASPSAALAVALAAAGPAREPPAPRPAPALPQGLQPVALVLAQPRGRRSPSPPSPPSRLFAALWVLFGLRTRWLGVPAAALALATVFATAMIYAQLRSVPALALAPSRPALPPRRPRRRRAPRRRRPPRRLASRRPRPRPARRLGCRATAASPAPAPRSPPPPASARSAACGSSRRRTPAPNYLLREMVHVVGRRHALKLRLARPRARGRSCRSPSSSPRRPLTLALAALLHVAGALVLRWLFFAEAEHVVGLYYGRR